MYTRTERNTQNSKVPLHELLERVDGALIAAAQLVAGALSAEGGAVSERTIRGPPLTCCVLRGVREGRWKGSIVSIILLIGYY